jgi:2-keto-4-pentenoate hydratase/2-oxohepta-3-ene-1,7-dioic acid hydratase in catechol pathway
MPGDGAAVQRVIDEVVEEMKAKGIPAAIVGSLAEDVEAGKVAQYLYECEISAYAYPNEIPSAVLGARWQWARFRTGDGPARFGMVVNDRIVECDGDPLEELRPTGASLVLAEVTLLSPCTPSKIVALWNNFHALAARLEKPVPQHPLFLIKPGSSVAGPGEAITRPAGYSGKIAYEGELGIVIGKPCKNIPESEAADYILGYTCVNDVTATDVLNENASFAQWTRAKGYDTFGCIGPVIASDLDWSRARVVTRLDGVERQNYPLSDMVFSPAQQVSRISRDMSLMPGDVIACGTSLGVGSMKDGSVVEVSIDGIGTLINSLGEPR